MATKRPPPHLQRCKAEEQATATWKATLPKLPPETATASGQTRRKANGSASLPKPTTSMHAFCGWKRAVGTTLYRSILREYGRVNQPKLIRDSSRQAESPPDAGVGLRGESIVWKPSQSGSIRRLLRRCSLSSKPLLSVRFRTSRPCNTLCSASKNSLAPINTTQHNHCLSTSLNKPTFIAQDSHPSKGMSDGTSTS